jgi:hypothetical protein
MITLSPCIAAKRQPAASRSAAGNQVAALKGSARILLFTEYSAHAETYKFKPVSGARRHVEDGGYGLRGQWRREMPWLSLAQPKQQHEAFQKSRPPSAEHNLSVKRTPNGRPRSGIMFTLASARPAVWRRLPLRYAPGFDAWAQVEPHAQHIVFDRR